MVFFVTEIVKIFCRNFQEEGEGGCFLSLSGSASFFCLSLLFFFFLFSSFPLFCQPGDLNATPWSRQGELERDVATTASLVVYILPYIILSMESVVSSPFFHCLSSGDPRHSKRERERGKHVAEREREVLVSGFVSLFFGHHGSLLPFVVTLSLPPSLSLPLSLSARHPGKKSLKIPSVLLLSFCSCKKNHSLQWRRREWVS